MKKNVVTGKIGEAKALDYLVKNKMKILKTNYSLNLGEIDIIAKDGDTIVFVEVKDRGSNKFGLPREAVTPQKQHKIRNVALCYLKSIHSLDASCRFDVVEIIGDEITLIKNAF
ncbi:MAG: YraN family protein [Clostridia bacterium]